MDNTISPDDPILTKDSSGESVIQEPALIGNSKEPRPAPNEVDKSAILEIKLAESEEKLRCTEVQVEHLLKTLKAKENSIEKLQRELQEAKFGLHNQQNGEDKITLKISATKGIYCPKADDDIAEEQDKGTTVQTGLCCQLSYCVVISKDILDYLRHKVLSVSFSYGWLMFSACYFSKRCSA